MSFEPSLQLQKEQADHGGLHLYRLLSNLALTYSEKRNHTSERFKKVKSCLLELNYSHNKCETELIPSEKNTPSKLQANQSETQSYSTYLKSSCTHCCTQYLAKTGEQKAFGIKSETAK